jgi:hypothetical protein
MGQAKQRGTREQRATQKQEQVEQSIEETKRRIGIPDEAKFIGYAIHLEEPDEFLASFDEDLDATKKLWSKRPQDALLFMTFEKCYETHRKCQNSVVAALFETEDQIIAAVDNNTRRG